MIVWAVVCQSTAIDGDSNLVSMFNALEQLAVSEAADGQLLPMEHQHISLWQRDDPDLSQEVEGLLRILNPAGEELGRAPFTVDLATAERTRVRHKLAAFMLKGEGRYVYETLEVSDGQESVVSRVPVTVLFEPSTSES